MLDQSVQRGLETRVFCAYLDPVQPSRMKSMVLRFASSGKRKVA